MRYRAWQPPSALHPNIGIQAPLVFDLIDTWNNKSIGGCTYHVVHPGGRNYEQFPVNANAAEARRHSRFESAGHTIGQYDAINWPPNFVPSATRIVPHDSLPRPMLPPAEEVAGDMPYTLDLRRKPVVI